MQLPELILGVCKLTAEIPGRDFVKADEKTQRSHPIKRNNFIFVDVFFFIPSMKRHKIKRTLSCTCTFCPFNATEQKYVEIKNVECFNVVRKKNRSENFIRRQYVNLI